MPNINPDSPAVKSRFASATIERFSALYEQAGFARGDAFAIQTRPMGDCVSQFLIGDKLHKQLAVNVKVKALDCSVFVAIFLKEGASPANPNESIEVRQTDPIRLRVATGNEGQPTDKGERAIQDALGWARDFLDALNDTSRSPQAIIDSFRQESAA